MLLVQGAEVAGIIYIYIYIYNDIYYTVLYVNIVLCQPGYGTVKPRGAAQHVTAIRDRDT